ncbi:MAG TPA: hypothetical protein VI431_00375 [Candidatus Acidoferrum sp.]
MHLPLQMKSKWIVFVSAVAIIFLGFVAIILAIQRMQGSHRLDRGLLLGIGFIIWGAWVLLSYKFDQDAEG